MFWEYLKTFNNNYAALFDFIVTIIATIVAGYFYGIYKESQLKEGDAKSIVSPVFWRVGRKYKILAVHEFEKSSDISGYNHLTQNSRPDQWQKLIKIKNSFFNLKHEVIPIDCHKILKVIISRDGREKWHSIHFNN